MRKPCKNPKKLRRLDRLAKKADEGRVMQHIQMRLKQQGTLAQASRINYTKGAAK